MGVTQLVDENQKLEDMVEEIQAENTSAQAKLEEMGHKYDQMVLRAEAAEENGAAQESAEVAKLEEEKRELLVRTRVG